jgi:hypothetical protein
MLAADKSKRLKHGLAMTGLALMVYGMLGISLPIMSASGSLNWLPPSFEWPIGYADGIITMPNGIHVVPHQFSGRVQVYDSEWQFLRGWNVDASLGAFKLQALDEKSFDVITARLRTVYTHSINGELIYAGGYSVGKTYLSFTGSSDSRWIQTTLLLLVFTNFFVALLVTALGIVIGGLAERLL